MYNILYCTENIIVQENNDSTNLNIKETDLDSSEESNTKSIPQENENKTQKNNIEKNEIQDINSFQNNIKQENIQSAIETELNKLENIYVKLRNVLQKININTVLKSTVHIPIYQHDLDKIKNEEDAELEIKIQNTQIKPDINLEVELPILTKCILSIDVNKTAKCVLFKNFIGFALAYNFDKIPIPVDFSIASKICEKFKISPLSLTKHTGNKDLFSNPMLSTVKIKNNTDTKENYNFTLFVESNYVCILFRHNNYIHGDGTVANNSLTFILDKLNLLTSISYITGSNVFEEKIITNIYYYTSWMNIGTNNYVIDITKDNEVSKNTFIAFDLIGILKEIINLDTNIILKKIFNSLSVLFDISKIFHISEYKPKFNIKEVVNTLLKQIDIKIFDVFVISIELLEGKFIIYISIIVPKKIIEVNKLFEKNYEEEFAC